ncbi:MAG: N-acetylglucosamine-6-phosphate deacetylase [Ilumatobacteraceae bacterium]
MSSLAVLAAGIASPAGVTGPATVLVDDGVITAIEDGHRAIAGRDAIGDGSQVVAAGLIDIHTHGAVGVQAIDGDPEGLTRLAAFYAGHGVTGFLGTIGGSREHIELGLVGLTDLIERGADIAGARCFGVHLEGPFISRCCPGAFRLDSIVAPDLATFEHYLRLANGALKLMTVAPEVDGQHDLIRSALAHGVVCSAGHSSATDVQTVEAIELGVTSLTHMFNAMPALHHRQPGIVGVGLTDSRLTAELIADGVHVHPTMVRLLTLAKGWEGIALITDSIAAAGLADGAYDFEEQQIVVHNGEARLADGTLAGSTLTLDRAVANFASFADVPWHQALASASLVPARLLGLADRKGSVAVGLDADLVGFDADREVSWTVVGGRAVFDRRSTGVRVSGG